MVKLTWVTAAEAKARGGGTPPPPLDIGLFGYIFGGEAAKTTRVAGKRGEKLGQPGKNGHKSLPTSEHNTTDLPEC